MKNLHGGKQNAATGHFKCRRSDRVLYSRVKHSPFFLEPGSSICRKRRTNTERQMVIFLAQKQLWKTTLCQWEFQNMLRGKASEYNTFGIHNGKYTADAKAKTQCVKCVFFVIN